ncbi:MAG: TonB-dependent receptor plug domain-containing protein [Desulfobacterales bacterium]|nr:TonB-dependent receptor plug domain-containing protein [Desulfobacterales bacterium]
MLMFVGEDIEVLSIASRKEESAWSAPAVVNVLTRNEIDRSGVQTLSQALDDLPGFHVEETTRGSIPYLRGIPNSALILFDTVPIGSGAERENNRIDYETSLVPVKRIEVIRGAGSVLWGPDAFAGVVNAVPFTGKDFSGFQAGTAASSNDSGTEAWLRHGNDTGDIASFFSVSARRATEDDTPTNVVSFWNDHISATPVDRRFGSSAPDDSRYLEFYGNLMFSDWLTLSARLSDSQKAFSVTDWEGEFTWEEQNAYESKLFKLEASRDIGMDSGVRFTGYYSDTGLDETIIDRTFHQKEYSAYGELIYERSLFAADALLTFGTSYREDNFKDVLVWDEFYPGYFTPANSIEELNGELPRLPIMSFEDYDNRLLSVFGQYRHKIRNIELWAGLRMDDHDRFEDKVSFSSGIAWSASSEWMIKTILGSGYRTPFAKQISLDMSNHLEQIKNINFQVQYQPNRKTQFAITLFRNDIDNHVVGDRYEGAGVSLPNSQTIEGVELEWKFSPFETLSFFGNATFLDNSGSDEVFLDFDFGLDDDDPTFRTLTHDYDTGSDIMFNLSAVWELHQNIRLIPQLEYFSQRSLYYSVGNETRDFSDAWLCNLRLQITDINSFDIDLFVNNLFDNRYETFDARPGHSIESINAGITLKYKW